MRSCYAYRAMALAAIAITGFVLAINMELAGASPVVVNDSSFDSKLDGPAANAQLGSQMVKLGDVNGDGATDYAVSVSQSAAVRGVWVLFGPIDSRTLDFSDMSPNDGYRIPLASAPARFPNVGDQNGDGVDDLMVQRAGTKIIYSVPDPATELPKCDPGGSAQTRCLDYDDPRSTDGGRLGFSVTSAVNISSSDWAAGDLDGDGLDEIVLPGANTSQIRVVANGLGSKCDSSPGLCTLDLDSLSAPDVVVLQGPVGVSLGQTVVVSGDTNGDGRDDIVASVASDGSAQPGVMVIYGRAWTNSPREIGGTVPAADGYKIDVPFSVFSASPIDLGDVNGDGLVDIGLWNLSLIPAPSSGVTVIYGREGTPDSPPSTDPPTPGTGVNYDLDLGGFAYSFAALGDLNGDGGDEFAIGSTSTQVDSNTGAGIVAIVDSKVGSDENEVTLDLDSPGSEALILGGNAANQSFGSSVIDAGDVDSDGVTDIGIGAQGTSVAGMANAGRFGVVSSARFYPGAGTGIAGSIETDSADLGGVANANRRESIAYFEYGVSDQYGQVTNDQSVGRSSAGRSFDVTVNGLTPDTEYHYRAVVVNDLGIKAYGADRTFKTAALPVERCEQDPSQPGCPGESGKQFCERNPSDAVCQGKSEPQTPRLSKLIVSKKMIKVKRGKKGKVTVTVVNTGDAAAKGVKICASGPKRFVKVPKCKKVGSLKAGAVASRALKLKVKKRARKGKKLALKLKATANGLGSKTARANVRVR